VANVIEIIIKARNQAGDVLNEVGGSLDKLSNLLASGVFAYAGSQFARLTFELGQTASEAQRLEAAFTGLAGADVASGMLQQLRRVSQGTISQTDLMLSANRAMMLGVTDNADEMARLLEIAIVRGQAMGVSATQAFDNLMTGIGRMSPLILDNLGIITGGQRVYDEYAASIGKAADALSDMEKRQALVQLVLEQGEGMTFEPDDASSWERAAAAFADLKVQLGLLINEFMRLPEILGLAADALTGLNNALDEGMTRQERATQRYHNFRNELEKQRAEGKLSEAQYWAQLRAAEALFAACYTGVISFSKMGEELARLNAKANINAYLMEKQALSTQAAADATNNLADAEQRLLPGADKVIADAQLASISRQLTLARNERLAAVYAWLGERDTGTKLREKYDEQAQSLRDLNYAMADYNGKLAILNSELAELTPGSTEYNRKLTEIVNLQNSAATSTSNLASELESLVSAVLKPTQVTWDDVVSTQLGDYMNKWDENARRLADIANRGTESPWAAYFEIPPEVLAQGDLAIRRWASRLADRIRTGLEPGMIDIGALDRMLLEEAERRRGMESLRQLGLQRAAALGLDLSATEVQSMFGDPAESAGLVMAETLTATVSDTDFGGVVSGAFEAQIRAERAVFVRSGENAMSGFTEGLRVGMTPSMANEIAAWIAPFVADRLESRVTP